MKATHTAFLLIGFQNDYFAPDGVLHSVIEAGATQNRVLEHTLQILDRVAGSDATIISTPILFSPDYGELPNPAGLMAQIRDLGAFKRGAKGGEVIPEIRAFGRRIQQVTGKTGFNAFNGTALQALLSARSIRDVVLLGVVTSVCIDSTGRAAAELGYNVTILSDCIAGRTMAEQEFYCNDIFPLYADVKTADQLLQTFEY